MRTRPRAASNKVFRVKKKHNSFFDTLDDCLLGSDIRFVGRVKGISQLFPLPLRSERTPLDALGSGS